MQGDGKGALYVPQGLVDGPMPTHYEPVESPFRNLLHGQQGNPTRKEYRRADNRMNPVPDDDHADVFPFVFTTSRLTEHHTAGGMSRYLEHLAELQPEMFVEVSPALATERGLEHMGWCHVITARSAIEGRVLVTERLRPLRVEGRTVHQVWMPYHWGQGGLVSGDSANDLFGISLDPNVLIQESKVGTCDVQPGQAPDRRRAARLRRRLRRAVGRRRPRGPGRHRLCRRRTPFAGRAGRGQGTARPPPGGGPVIGRNSLFGPLDPAPDAGYEAPPPRKGFFTDTSVCIGCKACEVACKEWNDVPENLFEMLGTSYDNSHSLNANQWRHVAFIERPAPRPCRTGRPSTSACRRSAPRPATCRTRRSPTSSG